MGKITVEMLAKEADNKVDDTLLALWEIGLNYLNSPKDIIKKGDLYSARKVLLIPSKHEITSVRYWASLFNLNDKDFRSLLDLLNIPVARNAQKLSKGSLKILRTEFSKKNNGHVELIETYTNFQQQGSCDTISNNEESNVSCNDNIEDNEEFELRLIGHECKPKTLTLEQVLLIHETLVKDFLSQDDPIEPPGPRGDNLIASAVFRQHTSNGGILKYNSVELCAAALLHSLIHNHPFLNGNKRTALVSLLNILDVNGLLLTASEVDLFKFIIKVSQHKIIEDCKSFYSDKEVLFIANWIYENTRPIERGDRPIAFRKLKQILIRYGCNVENTSGCVYKITKIEKGKKKIIFSGKKTLQVILSYHPGKDIDINSICKIRRELHLTENYGIDSAAFYQDMPTSLDEFIVKYRKTLNLLARL